MASDRDRVRSRAAGLLALGLALALGSCQRTGSLAARAGLPMTSLPAHVNDVSERWNYLESEIQLQPDLAIRFLFPTTAACREVLQAGADVQYRRVDFMGTVDRGQASCNPVGTLSVAEWIDRIYQPKLSPSPRDRVDFTVAHRDEKRAYVRGDFQLAAVVTRVGAGYDMIAIVEPGPACDAVLAEGSAYLEYARRGADPFTFHHGEQVCPVRGFAQPMGPRGWPER
jgi:hypothetical protein